MTSILANCKKCGGRSDADKFQVCYESRMAICHSCFTRRGQKVEKKETPVKKEIKKPAGWDKEDELLEQLTQNKKREYKGRIERIPGKSYVRFTCPHCNFKFKYYPWEKRPGTCPYCNATNPNIRATGLL
jgi:hypothetical protein